VSFFFCDSIGKGQPSDIVRGRTLGTQPGTPEAHKFLEVTTNSVTLHLGAWEDGGCPMLYYVVEHKAKSVQSGSFELWTMNMKMTDSPSPSIV
jgi:hypothetical protein